MNKKTQKIMLVGKIRQALNELVEMTGHEYSLYIPTDEARIAYEALEKEYTDFYELPLQERLYVSGMSKRPKETKV